MLLSADAPPIQILYNSWVKTQIFAAFSCGKEASWVRSEAVRNVGMLAEGNINPHQSKVGLGLYHNSHHLGLVITFRASCRTTRWKFGSGILSDITKLWIRSWLVKAPIEPEPDSTSARRAHTTSQNAVWNLWKKWFRGDCRLVWVSCNKSLADVNTSDMH